MTIPAQCTGAASLRRALPLCYLIGTSKNPTKGTNLAQSPSQYIPALLPCRRNLCAILRVAVLGNAAILSKESAFPVGFYAEKQVDSTQVRRVRYPYVFVRYPYARDCPQEECLRSPYGRAKRPTHPRTPPLHATR
jgi:hypothetical protein